MLTTNQVLSALTNSDIKNYLIAVDPVLQKVFEQVDIKSFDSLPKTPYVSLIGAIIGQIIRYEQAKSIRSNLYRTCGNSFDISTISQLTLNDWNNIGMDKSKVSVINCVNQYIVDHQLNLYNIEHIRSLKNVAGIGEWTIANTILTSFLDWDTFPCGDLFIRKRIKKLYNLNKIPTIREVRELSLKWKPYRTIVAWYFWRWF